MSVFRIEVPEEIERVFEKYDRTLMRKAFFRAIFEEIVNKPPINMDELERKVKCIVFGDFKISFGREEKGDSFRSSLSKLNEMTKRFEGKGGQG